MSRRLFLVAIRGRGRGVVTTGLAGANPNSPDTRARRAPVRPDARRRVVERVGAAGNALVADHPFIDSRVVIESYTRHSGRDVYLRSTATGRAGDPSCGRHRGLALTVQLGLRYLSTQAGARWFIEQVDRCGLGLEEMA